MAITSRPTAVANESEPCFVLELQISGTSTALEVTSSGGSFRGLIVSLTPSISDLYHGTSISSAEVWNSIGREVSSSGGSFGGLRVSLKLRRADLNHDSSSVGVKRWLRLSPDSWACCWGNSFSPISFNVTAHPTCFFHLGYRLVRPAIN